MADKQAPAKKSTPRFTGKKPDARRDPEKLRENQQRLGVGPEHKTASMKRGHRGTFP